MEPGGTPADQGEVLISLQLPPDRGFCKEAGGESNPRRWMEPSLVWNAPRVCLAALYERVGREMLEMVQAKQTGWAGTGSLSFPCPSGCTFSTCGFLSPLHPGVSQDGEKLGKGPDPVYLLHPGLVSGNLCMTTWALASRILGHGNVFHWQGLTCAYNQSLLPCRTRVGDT